MRQICQRITQVDVNNRFAQTIALVGLAILIVASPWAYGGVDASFQQWLFLVAILALLPTAVLLILEGPQSNRGRVSVVCLALIGAACLALLQLIPLSPTQLSKLSPTAAIWWQTLSTDGLPAAADTSVAHPLSLYPASTRHDLGLLGLAVAVFILANLALTERRAQLMLCGITATNGAVLAMFGIVQQLTSTADRLFWSVPIPEGAIPFASFVNRNHAGGYLNLCVATGLAILFWTLNSRQDVDGSDPDDFAEAMAWGSPRERWTVSLLAHLNARTLLVTTIAASAAAGVICSLSRGAILAMVCAGCVTAFVAIRARGTGSVAVIAMLVLTVGLGLSFWLGRGELLQERITETVAELESGGSSRIDHWQDVLSACRDYWLTGTGLGTYRYVYRAYETQLYTGWFYHAENQYLESLVEGGWLGLTLVLFAVGCVLVATVRLMFWRRDPLAFAIGLCGLYAIVAQAVHAFFDFGLYLPANAILLAAVCGMSCAKIPPQETSDNMWVSHVSWLTRGVHAAVLILSVVWLIWGGLQIRRTAAVATQMNAIRDLPSEQPMAAEQIASLIDRLEAAIKASPCDAEARFRLAGLYTLSYRAKAAAAMVEQKVGLDQEKLWRITAPVFLHRRASELARSNAEQFAALQQQDVVKHDLRLAWQNLQLARQCCPIMSQTNLALAELFVASPWQDDDEIYIQNAVRLAPNDPSVLFRAGLLDLHNQRISTGLAKWRKCLALSPQFTQEILQAGSQLVEPTQLLSEAIPDSPERIVEIARQMQSAELRRQLATRAEAALEHSPPSLSEEWYLRGAISQLRSDLATAVESYQRALELAPDKIEWRYECALLLAENNLLEEALAHASYCVRQAPRMIKHRDLLTRIRKQQAKAREANK